jgi:hypothetical protein
VVEDQVKRARDQPGERADRQAGDGEPDQPGAILVLRRVVWSMLGHR